MILAFFGGVRGVIFQERAHQIPMSVEVVGKRGDGEGKVDEFFAQQQRLL